MEWCVRRSLIPNENNSQFFIALAKAPIQDGRYMVFGNVVSGMEVLHSLERLGTWKGQIDKDVRIINSGELRLLDSVADSDGKPAKA